MKPDEILEQMANTFRERGKLYKQNYIELGSVFTAIFPNGLTLTTPEEFNRFALFLQIISKATRLANMNLQHQDSAHDMGVYAAILESVITAKEPVTPFTKSADELAQGAS